MTNILKAVKNIIDNPIYEIKTFYASSNRANSVGDALELYVKDMFANSFSLTETKRNILFNQLFSWEGSLNSPPDLIIREGDAVETKKVQSPVAALALNSSYPKAKLFKDSPMLTQGCRNCEDWTVKDIIYAIGHTSGESLKHIWLVYGDCFAADKEVYENVRTKIADGVREIPDVIFTPTKELGKVKKVDPLGVTDLRIRGMWHIDNPHKIFSHLECNDIEAKFQIFCLMQIDKFNSFPLADRKVLLELRKRNYSIQDVQIKNPNNPSKLLNCKLITYSVK